MLYLFDYIYRMFFSIKLISQFWSRSIVRLPNSDLQTKSHELEYKWFIYFNLFFRLLPFIWIQLLLLIMFISLIIWTIIGDYYKLLLF